MVKSDKCMGVSQLLGTRARAALPKSTPMPGGFHKKTIFKACAWNSVDLCQCQLLDYSLKALLRWFRVTQKD